MNPHIPHQKNVCVCVCVGVGGGTKLNILSECTPQLTITEKWIAHFTSFPAMFSKLHSVLNEEVYSMYALS